MSHFKCDGHTRAIEILSEIQPGIIVRMVSHTEPDAVWPFADHIVESVEGDLVHLVRPFARLTEGLVETKVSTLTVRTSQLLGESSAFRAVLTARGNIYSMSY